MRVEATLDDGGTGTGTPHEEHARLQTRLHRTTARQSTTADQSAADGPLAPMVDSDATHPVPVTMKLTILMSSFGDGGVERMVVNTATGLARRGIAVRFLVDTAEGPYLDQLDERIERDALPVRPADRLTRLVGHLQEDLPDALLVAKAPDARLALRARRRARVNTPLVMRPGTTLSARVRGLGGRWKLLRLARLYRRADAIIANSAGVREDIAAVAGVPRERIHLVRNPVITPELETLAREPVSHRWFDHHEVPVIIGAGGLRQQKDFSTLIRAFGLLRQRRAARLLILGRGRQEERLRELVSQLGLGDDVELAGFVANPYPWLASSDLFALSSRWEGSPNVLTEALALGTPAVATDCRSGPREILADGRYGPLVPVGDAAALARAMETILDDPPEPAMLRAATDEYTQERNAEHYHRILATLSDRRDG